MNLMIQTLRNFLVDCVKRIDNNDCNLEEEDAEVMVTVFREYTRKDERLSKYQSCKYLHISRATFDKYVADGKIPRGSRQQGFKELSWLKKDLDKFKEMYKKI